jgi:mRNA interferase RelE/StbE
MHDVNPLPSDASRRFLVEFTEEALAMLGEIQDRRVRLKVFERIQKLAVAPDQQGKALAGPLAGFRSVRAVGQRYRVIYLVEGNLVRVLVVGVGLRREGSRSDVYARTVGGLKSK